MSIYLDASATTKPKQEVIDAMMPYLTEKWYNPSSLYKGGSDVKKDIEAARKTIANFINAEPEEIYFTSGASESNSWAIQGLVNKKRKENKRVCIITSNIEHKSINSCIEVIKTNEIEAVYVDVDEYGFVDLYGLEDALRVYDDYCLLVTIGMANSEIGTIQNIKEISEFVHKHNGILHVDSTQAFGKIPIDVKEMGIDMMSASGHKISAVKGCGFLYIKNGINIQPLIYGSQQNNMRGGTENVAGIIGLAKAVELCDIDLEDVILRCEVRDNLIDILVNNFDCKLNGHHIRRLPNNINVTFPNISGESLLYMLDMSNIAVSTGSACNSKSIEPSYVLKAIGLSDEEAMSTIRITLPDIFNYTVEEYEEMINKFLDELTKVIKIIKT